MEKYMQHQKWSEKLIFGADWEFNERGLAVVGSVDEKEVPLIRGLHEPGVGWNYQVVG